MWSISLPPLHPQGVNTLPPCRCVGTDASELPCRLPLVNRLQVKRLDERGEASPGASSSFFASGFLLPLPRGVPQYDPSGRSFSLRVREKWGVKRPNPSDAVAAPSGVSELNLREGDNRHWQP